MNPIKSILGLGLIGSFLFGLATGAQAQEYQPSNEYTVRQIMNSIIQPATDQLWNPSSEYDDMGNPVLPTDEDSLNRLRWAAINLGASATLINMPDQVVDVPGTPAPNEESLSADEMNTLKRENLAAWQAFSNGLEALAKDYEKAIEEGDSEAFGWGENALGSRMNDLCTACHTVFWYPNLDPLY